MSVPGPGGPTTEQRPPACPRCGAALSPDQDWCLNCGAAVTTHVAGAPGWRTPVAIVGVVLLLAAAGLLVAFLELSDDADRVARAPVTTTPAAVDTPDPAPDPAGPTGAIGSVTGPTGSDIPAPDPTLSPPATGGTTGTATIESWPAGKEAWTVILKSASSRSEAETRARELQEQGTTVGVLESKDYSSLRAGYWVVFSGQYENQEAAQEAADGLKAKVPEAYARFVKP